MRRAVVAFYIRHYLAKRPIALRLMVLAILGGRYQKLQDWLSGSWRFVKQIFPLLIAGVFVVGIIRQLTRPQWIVGLAGETTLQGNLAGVVIGVSMYFPNRRGHEVPRREHPKGEEGEGAAGRTDSGGD